MRDVKADAKAIFLEALDCQGAEAQSRFLEQACGSDAALRLRVEELLRANGDAGAFLGGADPPGATSDQPSAERPGTVIGPYKLLQQIGEGGMGVVWMAEQTQPVHRKVALKVIKPGMDSRQVIARFEAERQALAMMDHVNIARVFDGGATENGRPYFVMELVHGVPITKYCDDNHLTPRERLELFVPVCQAIQHAHQKGIIHRDIKPSNVMVTLYDGKPVPKVIDFGVAKATEQKLTERTLFTQYGTMVGTLEYMSPEQAEMSALGVDTRSDIYSLGVLLYELLTGSTPLTHKRMKEAAYAEILRMIKEEEPPKPSTRLSDSGEALASISAQRKTEPAKLTKLVRGELDWIVMKCLEKDRNRRYETANGFAADVQRYLAGEAVLAVPPSAGYRLRKFARRNKGGLAVAALVLFVVVLLGSGAGWAVRDRSAREAEAARQQGERQAKVAGQVEAAFAEVDRLEREQKWPEALAAARRAAAVVAGGEADAETTERVHARLKDLVLIDRLEQIRVERNGASVDLDRGFAQAFRDYGVDVDELAVEACIKRLGARPSLAIPLAAALDDWNSARRSLGTDTAGWMRLVAIAHGIDPEPLRDRLRSTPFPPTPETRDELRRLAESIDVRAHHPATLYRLASTLWGDHQLRILRDAQVVYTGDYWINMELVYALGGDAATKKDLDEAIRFSTVAAAIRPSARPFSWLGKLLHRRGDLDEAIAVYRRTIEAPQKEDFIGPWPHYLGRVLRDQGKPDEAIAVYRQAITARPEKAGDYWRDIGDTLRDQKKPAEAADAYRQAIDTYFQVFKNSRHGNGLHEIRDLLREQKKLDEALAVFRQAIEVRPEYAERCWEQIGDILRQQKKLDEAIAAYQQAIAATPEPPHTVVRYWMNIGDILLNQGKTNEAVAAYRQAITVSRQHIADVQADVARKGFDDYFTVEQWIGDKLREHHKLDEAIAVYREGTENWPNNPGLHHRLGLALRDHNKPVEANAAFDRAIELYRKRPGWTPAYRYSHIGVVLRDKGELEEAIAAFRKAFDNDPKHGSVTRDLVDALRTRGRPDEAIAVYRKAVEADPKNFHKHNDLGNALTQQGTLDEAIAVYRKAVELAPTPNHAAMAYFNIGIALTRQKKVPEAIAAYYRVIELDPKSANADNAYLKLGGLLRDWKKLDEVIAVYRQAIEARPDKATSYYCDIGFILNEQQKPAEAIAAFREAIKLAPTPKLAAMAYFNLGIAFGGQNNEPEAITAYRMAIQLDPQNLAAAAYINLGGILLRQNKLDEALDAFRKAAQVNQPYANVAAHISIADVLSRQNKLDEAVAAYRKVIELEKNSPRSHNAIAWILATRPEEKLRDPKQAVALAKRAVELKSEEGNYWNTLGAARYRAGDYKGAVAALMKYRELRTNDAEWTNPFFLAMAHWKLDNKVEAARWHKLAVEWMEQKKANSEMMRRVRAEAAELLAVEKKKD